MFGRGGRKYFKNTDYISIIYLNLSSAYEEIHLSFLHVISCTMFSNTLHFPLDLLISFFFTTEYNFIVYVPHFLHMNT